MTDEEKKQLVDAVITQLKSEGTDVSNANIVSNANGIDYVVAYGKNGQIVRAVPTAISSEKVGASGYMNAYTEAGVYNINTRGGEDLPIDNQGAISARLTVLVTESGGNKVITQVINLNNNEGGEGNVYIRSCQNGEWKAWGKLQTNVEVGQINTLDNLTDNGIYSGVFTDGTPTSAGTFYDTFVLIVINNYAVSIPTGYPQSISQLKYSLGLDGSISVASRKRDQYGYWDNWASLDEKSLVEEEKSRAERAEQTINDKLDEEIERSVAADQDLLRGIDEEARRATEAEAAIKSRAIDAVGLNVAQEIDGVRIDFATLNDGAHSGDITIPAATTESAGVMSAEDKMQLKGIIGTGYDLTIIEGSYLSDTGSPNSNSGYKRTDFIPVIEGATLSVTGRKVCAYNENKQFVSVLSNNGGDIIIPSQVRYIRVDAAKTSVLDITRDGSPLLGVALLQDVCNANNSFKNIYSKYTLSSGYYAAGSGIAQANSAYVKTDYIRVSGNVYFNIRCLRACFYDADKKFLSSIEGAKEHIVVPENAVYVTFSYPKTAVEGKNLVIYGDRINEFIVYKDEFESAIKQLREEVTDAYVTQYTNNLTNEQDSTVSVVSGEYGAVGAKYSLPVKCTGKYSLHFEFKYPTTEDGSRIEILRFANISKTASTNGGVRMYIDNKGYIISEQQIRSSRVVALAPITSNNNYVARIGTSTSYASLQTGNDAFSLRYLGSNQTATMSITDSGLEFTGVTEVNAIPFPSNASMLDFANTLKSLCSEGGSLNGVFDFAAYDVFGRSTADLTKVANIPLYYTYSYGADNFPVFVPYNDDNWHSVDIVFDSSATKGWDLLSFFFDGHRVNYVDGGFTLTGNGVFNTNVTIGGDGIAVRNLKYTDRCTKIDAPVISIEMLHNIKDDLSLGGQEKISVSEIERVIAVYKKHGYKHIPLSEISQYIRGNKALSGKYFCLVHDDYFYNSPKLLNLYKGMDCKVCFALINEVLREEVADEYKKNSSQFEYAIHSETSYASLKYDSLVQKVRSDMANLGNRLNSITNMLVYPFGATNRGVGKVLFHEGITVALTVGDNRASMNCNPMILPRMPSRATGAFENLDSSLANVDKYYKE